MYNNGVTHKTESSDLEGVYTILKWLSYIPKVRPMWAMLPFFFF